MSLLSELRNWRNNQARIEGVEGYRVLPNTVLEALVGALPQTKDELLAIKGIKEAKFAKYGATLLRIIATQMAGEQHTAAVSHHHLEARSLSHKKSAREAGRWQGNEEGQQYSKNDAFFQSLVGAPQSNTNHLEVRPPFERKESRSKNQELRINQKCLDWEVEIENRENQERTLSVSQFLDGLNIELSGMAARIRGEVSSVDVRERVVYFTLKDSSDDSTLSCLIFRQQYTLSGVEVAIGDEIIVEGAPDIYKPNGRLSLKAGMIELCGEGALQKAYTVLKQKLESEGVFALEKKRKLPEFPTRIALITSEQGAAIGDFTMNLGAQGFHVDFYPTSVEGKKAVVEILEALRYFSRHAEQYDVLVLIRGGGSLESLQAFNNEMLVRETARCPIPTLVGVGHEKDVTLAALAADVMVSTPTAAARTLRAPWDEARGVIRHFEQQLPVLFERELSMVKEMLSLGSGTLITRLLVFLNQADRLKQALMERFFLLQSAAQQARTNLAEQERHVTRGFAERLDSIAKELCQSEGMLAQYDPKRVLWLGYSLVRRGQQIIKDADSVAIGDILEIQLSRGKIGARVETIIPE